MTLLQQIRLLDPKDGDVITDGIHEWIFRSDKWFYGWLEHPDGTLYLTQSMLAWADPKDDLKIKNS